jgi:hypothetical protein
MCIKNDIAKLELANQNNFELEYNKVLNSFKTNKNSTTLRIGIVFKPIKTNHNNNIANEKLDFGREFKYEKLFGESSVLFDIIIDILQPYLTFIKDLKIIDMCPAMDNNYYVKFNLILCKKDELLVEKIKKTILKFKHNKIVSIDFALRNPFTIKSSISKYYRPNFDNYIFNIDFPYQRFIFDLLKNKSQINSFSEYKKIINKIKRSYIND